MDSESKIGRVAFMNGSFVPEEDAHFSIFDTAVATGEKVVEVTRTFHHKPFKLESHLERLYEGLDTFQINPGLTPDELIEITNEAIRRNVSTQSESVDWQIMHYISRGPAAHFEIIPEEHLRPTVLIHCIPLVNRLGKMAQKYSNGADLVVVEQRAIPQEILRPQIKSSGRLDHVLGRLQAKQVRPGSTGVLLDKDGYLTEGTGTNLFLVKGGVIQTAPAVRVLTGITRGMIFDIAHELRIPIEEADLNVRDGENADEIFITSTVICQLHARSFDGKSINDGKIGPITSSVRQAFIEAIGLDYVQQATQYDQFLRENGPLR